MDSGNLSDLFEDSSDDIFRILEAFDGVSEFNQQHTTVAAGLLGFKDNEEVGTAAVRDLSDETEAEAGSPPRNFKRQKTGGAEDLNEEEQPRISHITVERNRRKQMNGHLSVLRSLMPSFYVKRGDQASIIGGVVDYINELHHVLDSFEAKKQRKVYTEVLASPRKPALSPRMSYPISPTTPTSPYNRPNNNHHTINTRLPPTPTYLSTSLATQLEPPPPPVPPYSCSPATTSSSVDSANELAANSKSEIAEVEVKFSGANVVLKTVSPRIPGQAMKIISALENLSLEILHVIIGTINDDTMLNSFTIKIGIECQLSAEELAQQIQQTFC